MKESEIAFICKALGDENRVQILKMLTGGELCACKILDAFNITQPTLSHHMKILTDCNLVNSRKEGKWTYYSINSEKFSEFKNAVSEFTCKTSTKKKSSGKCCCKDQLLWEVLFRTRFLECCGLKILPEKCFVLLGLIQKAALVEAFTFSFMM